MELGYLNVTIRYEDKEIDLRFSKFLSLQEVKELMCKNGLDKKLNITTSWHLDIYFKRFRSEQHRPLVEYPLGNGDILEVVINER